MLRFFLHMILGAFALFLTFSSLAGLLQFSSMLH